MSHLSPNPVSLYDRLYLRFFYLLRSWNFDLPENKVGWRSRQNQELRFQALLGIDEMEGKKILDLGCGLGCLYGFLKNRGWKGHYTGIDILPFMIRKARRRFPDAHFELRDILKNPPKDKWDFVLINGVFNHKVRNNWGWIEQMVQQSMALTTKGMAFNLLNAETAWYDPELFYADLKLLEEKVGIWSKGKYKIVEGYLEEDVTVYLYH